MADDEHDEFHLPSPSGQPIIASLGVTLLLAGLIPSSAAVRLALMAIGFTIAAIGIWLWVTTRSRSTGTCPTDGDALLGGAGRAGGGVAGAELEDRGGYGARDAGDGARRCRGSRPGRGAAGGPLAP